MKSKRVLELKEFEAQYKQRKLEFEKAAADRIVDLQSEIEKAELVLQQYVEQEFAHYVKCGVGANTSQTRISKVDGGTPGRYVYVEFSNGCHLEIPPPPPSGDPFDADLWYKNHLCIVMSTDETTSDFVENYRIEDQYLNERLVACAEVFGDVIALVREVVPRWFDAILPELDVESLMTSRVLRWVSKQIGGQWPDVVAGHVVDKI